MNRRTLLEFLFRKDTFIFLAICTLFLNENHVSMALIFATVWTIRSYYKTRFIRISYLDIILPAYFLYALVSFFWTSNRLEYGKEIAILVPFLIIPFVSIFTNDNTKRKIERVFVFAIVFNNLFHIIAAIYKFAVLDKGFNEISYFNFSFPIPIHPSYYSLAVLFSLIILLFGKNLRINFKQRVFFILINSLTIFALQSKINMLLFVFIMIIYLLTSGVYKNKLITGLLVIVFGFFFFLFHDYVVPRLNSLFDSYNLVYLMKNLFSKEKVENIQIAGRESTGIRLSMYAIFRMSIETIGALGYGLGGFKTFFLESCTNFRNGYYCQFYKDLNAHNQFIQTFVNLGFIGFIVLLSKYVFYIYRYAVQRNLGAILVVFVIIVNLLFESFYLREKGVVLIAFSILFLNQNESSNSIRR